MDKRFTDVLRPFLPLLGDTEPTEQSNLRDLGLDSMQAVNLLFAIEDELGVSLPDEDLNEATFATAGSLWHAVSAASGDEAAA